MRAKSERIFRRLAVVLCLVPFGLVPAVGAQDSGDGDKGPLSKLTIHGFLTQAYADADFSDGGPVPDEITIGIPEDGTFDYRFLALQFRYQMTPKDTMIIQFSSRRLGESPIGLIEDDIELDWAFYQRQLKDNTHLKIGRVQIPLGIFNEIRDVGTILPFYRPPFTFYREGSFTSETVDGVLLTHTFGATSNWALDFDVYLGGYDLVESSDLTITEPPKIARAKDVLGVQLWLNTPVSGLRFGLGGQRRDVTKGQEGLFRPIGGETTFEELWLSVDAVFNKFVFRSEYRKDNDADVLESDALGFSADPDQELFYVQAGYNITEKLRIFAQLDQQDVEFQADILTQGASFTQRKDLGVALNYVFTPYLVLKLEHHWVDAALLGFAPVFLPAPPFFQLAPIVLPFDDGSYSILSLATSF